MGVRRQYHEAFGQLIFRHEGTVEHFAGDGVFVLFNDPLPCPDHSARAVRMAIDMRACVGDLSQTWRRYGPGWALASASRRAMPRSDKSGSRDGSTTPPSALVANLASRLCDEAADGEILLSQRALAAIEDLVEAEPVGELVLKGFVRPVMAYRVHRLRP